MDFPREIDQPDPAVLNVTQPVVVGRQRILGDPAVRPDQSVEFPGPEVEFFDAPAVDQQQMTTVR